MLKHWRIVLLFALVVAVGLWIQWWASWDFPLEHAICGEGEAPQDCDSYNVFFFSAWRLAIGANYWSVLITALATVIVAVFTGTIYEINRSQLAHSRQVERSYLWPGFGKHREVTDGMRWFVTITNTGRVAGVIQVIRYAVVTPEEFDGGKYEFRIFTDREDVIPPGTGNPGQETGLHFVIKEPMICCGWIEYEDVFGGRRKQGWMHRLTLSEDFAGNWSHPFPGCYSSNYKPWEGAKIAADQG